MREGLPVVKSRLTPSDDAAKVAAYLKAKAAGQGRKQALDTAGLTISDTSAIGMEWNALTYAGHTPWNVRYEVGQGGYVGGAKRRPRSEWIVQRDTHPALITEDEAEILLNALETTSKKNARRTKADYLLSGILQAPDGTPWWGEGEGFYRNTKGSGKRVKAETIEQAVLASLAENLRGPEFVAAFTAAAKAQADDRMRDTELPKLKKELADIEKQVARLTGLLGQTTTPEPLLRQIETHEQRRVALSEEVERRAEIEADAAKVRALTEAQVSRLLRSLAEDMTALDRDQLKDFVRGMLDKVELDAAAATYQLYYRLAAGFRVASPRLGESKAGSFAWLRTALRAA
jgi:site-specific DNA recombinase